MTEEFTMDNYNQETRHALMEQSMQHMNQKLDQSVNQINQTLSRFETSLDKIDEEIKETRKELKSDIKSNFFWTLGVIGVAFGAIAHGLKWF